MDNIILTIFFLRLQTNIPFIDRILEKLSELSGGREEIVLLALFILVLLFLLFIRGRIKKVKQKKALEYHIEEKDKYHISMEKKDLSSLVSLLIEGLYKVCPFRCKKAQGKNCGVCVSTGKYFTYGGFSRYCSPQ